MSNLSDFYDNDELDDWENDNIQISTATNERYIDLKLVASGGQKNIYSTYDTKLQRSVALAELHENIPAKEIEGFINEVFLTASFQHPNIIKILDFGLRNIKKPFFTMELMIHSSLNDYIKNCVSYTINDLQIFLKICDAISYAHSKNVIHLDLKPSNILVGHFGEVLICDWGLSKKSCEPVLNKHKRGTPAYMAPEQCTIGEYLTVATDIYSLGIILKQFYSDDKSRPLGIDAVIKKATQLEVQDRYNSVEELQKDVSNYINGYSTIAQQAGFFKEFQLLIQRNRQLCFAGFSAFSVIIIMSILFFLSLQDKNSNLAESLHKLELTGQELQSLVVVKTELNNELNNRELVLAKDLMHYPLYFSSPKRSSEQALQIYERQSNILNFSEELFMIYMIQQNFKAILKQKIKAPDTLVQIAVKYSEKEKNHEGIFKNPIDFIAFLKDINQLPKPFNSFKQKFMERAVCYRDNVEEPIVMSPHIVREIIKAWNPEWNENFLIYNLQKQLLKIRGSNLKVLCSNTPWSSHYSFLRFLKFNDLVLNGTGIQSLSHIKGLKIFTVDIRNTPINNLHPHAATRDIGTAYISPNQFPPESLNHLPPEVQIIQKD